MTVASHPPAPSAPCGPFVSPVGGEQRRPPLAGRRWGREAPWRGREHRGCRGAPAGAGDLCRGCEWRGSTGPRGRGPGGCRPAGRCPGAEQDGSGTRRPGRARGAQGGGRPLRLLSLLPGAARRLATLRMAPRPSACAFCGSRCLKSVCDFGQRVGRGLHQPARQSVQPEGQRSQPAGAPASRPGASAVGAGRVSGCLPPETDFHSSRLLGRTPPWCRGPLRGALTSLRGTFQAQL